MGRDFDQERRLTRPASRPVPALGPISLPALSLAARQDRIVDGRVGIEVAAGVRLREPVREMTVFADQYDFALSLLLLGDDARPAGRARKWNSTSWINFTGADSRGCDARPSESWPHFDAAADIFLLNTFELIGGKWRAAPVAMAPRYGFRRLQPELSIENTGTKNYNLYTARDAVVLEGMGLPTQGLIPE